MKKLIALNLGLFIVVLFASTPLFASDITDISNDKNETAINYLIDNNIVQGYEDGTFKPDSTINRAEFTKIIVEATYDDATIESCLAEQMKPGWTYTFFSDVDRNAWFAKYICVAKIKGVVKGYSDGLFKPNDKINKAEAIKIIMTAKGYSVPESVTETLYSDIEGDEWFAPYVKVAMDNNLLEDTGSSALYVNAFLTRGGMSEMTYRTLVADGGSFEEAESASPTASAENELTNLIATFLDTDSSKDIDNSILNILDTSEKNYIHNAILMDELFQEQELANAEGDDDLKDYLTRSFAASAPSARKLMSLSPIPEEESERKITYYSDNVKAYVGVAGKIIFKDETSSSFFYCYPFIYKNSWKLKLPTEFSGQVDFSTTGVVDSCGKEMKTDASLDKADLVSADFIYATPYGARVYLNDHLIKDLGRLTGGRVSSFLPLISGKNSLQIVATHDIEFEDSFEGSTVKEGEFEEMADLEPDQLVVEIDKGGKTLIELYMLKSKGTVTKEFEYQP